MDELVVDARCKDSAWMPWQAWINTRRGVAHSSSARDSRLELCPACCDIQATGCRYIAEH